MVEALAGVGELLWNFLKKVLLAMLKALEREEISLEGKLVGKGN